MWRVLFACSCTWGHLLGFYVANTFAEKLVRQFICGKQKLSITSISSCIWLVTYLSHVFIYTFAKLCAIMASLLKPIFCIESKHICCIIYTSNRICHGKLSNKNCSCKRGFKHKHKSTSISYGRTKANSKEILFCFVIFIRTPLFRRICCIIVLQRFGAYSVFRFLHS